MAATVSSAMTPRRGTARLELSLRGREVRLDLADQLLALGRRRAALDLLAQLGRDRLLELLVEVRVDLAERPLDLLEVVDVRLGDGLLGGSRVAGLHLHERLVERALDGADLGDGLLRRRLLLGGLGR